MNIQDKVNAFLISCLVKEQVKNLSIAKENGHVPYCRLIYGIYGQDVFSIDVFIFQSGDLEVTINTESKEAIQFINSFDIIAVS